MESNKRKLNVASYSEYPGPRYCTQGEYSGEDFYHSKLNSEFAESILQNTNLVVNLDGTAGYASSFLDEAFGNLVFDFSESIVREKLEIISKQEPDWKQMIFNDVINDWEVRRRENKVPKKTIKHEDWFRYQEGHLVKKRWL